jgi:hypothetical protein
LQFEHIRTGERFYPGSGTTMGLVANRAAANPGRLNFIAWAVDLLQSRSKPGNEIRRIRAISIEPVTESSWYSSRESLKLKNDLARPLFRPDFPFRELHNRIFKRWFKRMMQ